MKNSSLSLHDKATSQIEVEIKNSIEVQQSKQEVLIYCLTYNKHFINQSDHSHTKSIQVNLGISCWHKPPGGGGAVGISGWGCAARTLEPLAYTRASFSWILLPYTRVNSWFPKSR